MISNECVFQFLLFDDFKNWIPIMWVVSLTIKNTVFSRDVTPLRKGVLIVTLTNASLYFVKKKFLGSDRLF